MKTREEIASASATDVDRWRAAGSVSDGDWYRHHLMMMYNLSYYARATGYGKDGER